jgi:ribosomal protein S18 acetylase RimI-like enzyme
VPLVFEPLSRQHDRAAFSCGQPALDDYLKRQARQDVERRFAFCYVLCERGNSTIQGYYTLSSISVDLTDLPPEIRSRLPRYGVVPATLVGRLAVDSRFHGQGLGSALLVDAVRRTAESYAAAALVIVDAIDDAAEAFYRHFGFLPLGGGERRLYLPLPDVRRYFTPRGG